MNTTDPIGYLEKASKWEASRTQSAERSERRAWIVAGGLGLGLVLACSAIIVMMPLKQTVPYVVRVDSATGVPDIVSAMTDQVVSGDDVMSKYWLAKYITHRETYDSHTIETDYNAVGVLSGKPVGVEYAAQFQGENATHERLGDKVKTNVQIISVVPNGDTGTVRFRTTTKRVKTNKVLNVDHWVATVAFEYQNTAPMTESVRLVNPFGFRVTSYRVDPEFIGSDS